MNQTQRDLTYRLESLKQICSQYGYNSETCQRSTEIWESQHAMNVLYSQVSFFGSILGFFVLGIILCFFILKPKTNKAPDSSASPTQRKVLEYPYYD